MSRSTHFVRIRFVVLVLGVALALLALAGCGAKEPTVELDPPARAVQELLELRYERSTDASAYAEYLSTPELAQELARASEEETSDVPPTPEWEPPYVSVEASSTAEVVVVWKDRSEHEEWPPATIFSMELLDERWAAVDARTLDETETVPLPVE